MNSKKFFFFCCALFIILTNGVTAQVSEIIVDAGPDVSASCTNPCVTLNANYVNTNETNTYVVFPTVYAPYSFTTGQQIFVNQDDIWTNIINLPFNFCFFGNNYDKVVIGANGIISFNTTYAGNNCPWNLQGAPNSNPIPNNSLPLNSIMGIYQDIDPTNQGQVYYLLTGTFPNRRLIVSYYQVPYYGDPNSVSTGSCPNPLFATMQIVLHETTNVIDMYVQSKPFCTGWNQGRGIQGIQNATGTVAFSVPGRNNQQFSLTNDGMLFVPIGALTTSVRWLDNTGAVIGTTGSVSVCPSVPTPYVLEVTYGTCSGNSVVLTDTVVVSPASSLASNVTLAQAPSCIGSANASATATPSGGIFPYTYLWSNGATTATATGLTAGTYTVTVTDGSGCNSVGQITIANPAGVVINPGTLTNVSCNGGNNGSIPLTASGGQSPYSWLWSNGAVTATASGLTAGTYTATVTDNLGCTAIWSGSITQPTALSTGAASVTSVSCFGLSDGSATITPSGGTSPYLYLWSPSGGTSSTAINVPAGNYTVTVTDSRGCTATASAIVPAPVALTTTVTSQTNVSCNGYSDGAASINVNGGTGPYTYSWSPSGGSGSSASGLPAASYVVLVTDNNGCQTNQSITITQPTGMTIGSSIQNVACAGGSNGSISLNVSAGTSPYTYLWSNGATAANLTALAAGSYTATVTDANGCTAPVTSTITQPSALNIVQNSLTQVSCAGGSNGSISVTVSGGTSPYSYLWSNGTISSTVSGLAAGNYSLTVTDNAGCTQAFSATITQPTAVTASVSGIVNASCFGGNDGSATASATGGSGTYTYQWSNGSVSALATGLSNGSYTVTATDQNGCTSIAIAVIGAPPQLTASLVSTVNVSCNGGSNGSLTISAAGGNGGYQYLWSPTGGTATTATGLNPGTYSVTITDVIGCTTVLSGLTVSAPQALVVSSAVQDVLCNGGATGSISLNVIGGTPPYDYQWNNGAATPNISNLFAASYTATVTDNNGCTSVHSAAVSEPSVLAIQNTSVTAASCNGFTDGSVVVNIVGGTGPYQYAWTPNVSTTASASGLGAGTYSYVITDNNGCTTAGSSTVNQPPPVTTSLSSTQNVTCFGGNDGTLTVTAGGGTAPYTYAWSPSGGTAATAANLTSGTYSVLVTDNSGCSFSLANLSVTEPTPINAQLTPVNVSCPQGSDASVSLVAAGGTSPYTYSWNNGASSATITGLSAGTYTATVTDNAGCTALFSQTVTEPAAFAASASTSATTCNGANGAATVTISGGTSPYQFLWSNGSATPQLQNVSTGNFAVIITDANACTYSTQVFVPALPVPTVSISGKDTTCETVSVNLSANVLNGVAPVTYVWNPGTLTTSGVTVTPLTDQVYTVLITDANNCTATASHSVSVEPAPVVTILDPDTSSCMPFGFTFSGTVDIPNSTYLWNFGDLNTSTQVSPLHNWTTPGIFNISLEATSPAGCKATAVRPGMITIHPFPDADFVVRPEILFDFQPTAFFQNTTTGGSLFWWDFGDSSAIETSYSPEHTYSDTGIYIVTLIAESEFGCRDTVKGPVRYQLESCIYVPMAFTPNSDGKNDQFEVVGTEVESLSITMKNRWGQTVFAANSLSARWDGTLNGTDCPNGTYVYLIKYRATNGKEGEMAGRVTLYR